MANNKPRGKHARVETLTNELFEKDTEEEIEESSSEFVEQQEEEQATSSDTTDESGETAENVHEASLVNVNDTSRVIDLDEVIVVAQPKEGVLLRQQPMSSLEAIRGAGNRGVGGRS